jgi:hypothetical protein
MAAGEPAGGDAARAVARRHRAHMTRWFYGVSPEMHRRLAEMYIADPRFADHYERIAPGLAAYVHDAIIAGAVEVLGSNPCYMPELLPGFRRQASMAMCSGWAATRASHARSAGNGCSVNPPSGATWV